MESPTGVDGELTGGRDSSFDAFTWKTSSRMSNDCNDRYVNLVVLSIARCIYSLPVLITVVGHILVTAQGGNGCQNWLSARFSFEPSYTSKVTWMKHVLVDYPKRSHQTSEGGRRSLILANFVSYAT